MRRRLVLQSCAVAAVAPGAVGRTMAHTPYRQWAVYRQRHLIVGTSREDAATYPLGRSIVAVLERHLPEASARVTRARTDHRLASLLGTDQLRVVLLPAPRLTAIARGEAEFADVGPVALRVLYRFGDHLLASRADFPEHHAWLVTRTLAEHGDAVPGAVRPDRLEAGLAVHPGAIAALRGEPMPAREPWVAETDDDAAVHAH